MEFTVSTKVTDNFFIDDTKNYLDIRKLTHPELPLIEPMLEFLYPNLEINTLRSRIEEISNLNWSCLGVFDKQEKLVALSGYWINTRLYCGKYLYIDHFIVNQKHRGKGIGSRLLEYIKDIAKNHQCEQICLDTFISNSLAKKFWFQHNFSVVGLHFNQSLSS